MHKANAGKSPVYASFGSTRTVGTSVQSKLKQGEERGGGGERGQRSWRERAQRDRERETDRRTDRKGGGRGIDKTDRQTDRQRWRDRDRERQTERQRQTET